ncbi:PQQ-dependent sugar dehydrogenase [Aquirufa ecclesiirivi]
MNNFTMGKLMRLLMLSCVALWSFQGNAQAPDENRFVKSVLMEKLDEPMEMVFLPDGRILFVERKGDVKQYNPSTKETKVIGHIVVNTKYKNRVGMVREAEEGLMGIAVDPNFKVNHWLYLYYAHPTESKHILVRMELKGEELLVDQQKVVLEVPTQREECCHTGGGMVFDKSGNLFLTVGNNTSNSNSDGYAPIDERAGQAYWDDQRGAANTNNLLGKILRIHPEKDGSYTIPKGNLFPVGTPKTRPEIYTMGHRNPWRVSIDSKTGYIYWGEVGPDASVDSDRGPRGYDEFNQAKGPGFFGWPYFIGDNKAYADYNFENSTVGPRFNPAKPLNESPNNDGLKELPAAQKAFIWYPYGTSEEFPLVGASGRSATGGPVYHRSDFPTTAKRAFPSYYEGKWLIVEFMRGWIMSVTLDENGNYKSMERFLPNQSFGSAIDMKFSPDGDLYVLEYGSAWFRGNDNARLVKIEYQGGNRKPSVEVSAGKLSGALPFKTKLSSEGTKDYDGDKLTYTWTVKNQGKVVKTLTGESPELALNQAGKYQVVLKATDPKGLSNTASLEVQVGNESPKVDIVVPSGNKSFYFPGQKLAYQIQVEDKEDGVLGKGIAPESVAATIDYIASGYDPIEMSQSHRKADSDLFASVGLKLINQSDCKSCHLPNVRSVGPSYQEVAAKYKGQNVLEQLSAKIISGGMGVWGEHAMSAHPQISKADAKSMVNYILSLGDKKANNNIPLAGEIDAVIPKENVGSKGVFVVRATYLDKGNSKIAPAQSEKWLLLRHPSLDPEKADLRFGIQQLITPARATNMVGQNPYIAYKQLDLTGIKSMDIAASAQARTNASGGVIEIRLDSPTGTLIGKTTPIAVSQATGFGPPPAAANTQQKGAPLGTPTTAPTPAAGAPAGQGGGQRRMGGPAPVKVDIQSVSGTHDVYFVAVNPQTAPQQIVVQISGIEVKE